VDNRTIILFLFILVPLASYQLFVDGFIITGLLKMNLKQKSFSKKFFQTENYHI